MVPTTERPVPDGGRGHGAIVACVVLAWSGLLACLLLLWRHAHPTAFGLCEVGSSCDEVLSSRYATLLSLPLAAWGVILFGALLVGTLGAALTRNERLAKGLLRGVACLALLGTLALGGLLYLQLAVLRAFCPLCTLCAFLVAGVFVVVGRARLGPGLGRLALRLGLALTVLTLLAATVLLLTHRRHVVARIDGVEITDEELERALKLTLFGHEQRLWQAKRAWIDERLTEVVLAEEAAKRGVSVEKLVEDEILRGVKVTDDEVEERLGHGVSEEERREAIRRTLLEQKRIEQRRAWVAERLSAHEVTIDLPSPHMPRIAIDETLAHKLGPDDAPVHLVVFSEFECPYCAQLAPVVARIHERFPQEVQIAYFHFPLPMHARSAPAARAAECAAAQGRFWAYHRLLFEGPDALDRDALVAHAAALGLDGAAFAACLDGEEAAAAVRAHVRVGESLPVKAVPALFLNGLHVGGFVAYEELERQVEQELRGPWKDLLVPDR